MIRKNTIALWFYLLTLICPLLVETQEEFAQLDHLMSSARYEEALDEIRRMEHALPLSEQLTAWEIDFRGEVLRVAHGREHLYYQLHLPNSHQDAPGRQGALKSISANFQRSDWQFAVVCVALKTGEIRWSRLINGGVYLAVDPQTDILYLYRERLLALSPESGKVLEEHDLPGKIQGLLLGQVLSIPQPHGSNPIAPNAKLFLYDPRRKLTKQVNVSDYWLLAPDESCRLVPGDPGWDCVRVPDGQKLWSLQIPHVRGHAPVWYGDHPIFVTGTEWQRSTVTAIDISTGQPRWSTDLGWGTYVTNQHQLRGGGYQDNWTPLTTLHDYLLALDGSGRLYFLDPTNGRSAASLKLASDYLAMPFQYDGQLIVSSFNWVRSYSIANLIEPGASVDALLQVRKAQCLLALGRQNEALVALDQVVERAPQFRTAWIERVRVCETLNDSEEEVYSRSQALSLSEQVTDDILYSRWGLLRLYNLQAKPSWSLAQLDGHVYAGTLAGLLWGVRTDNLDLGLVSRLDHEIAALEIKPELQVVLGDPTHSRQPVPRAPVAINTQIPREWYTMGGEQRISKAISYRGRQFRSLRGGVRILSGIEMTDLPSRLDDVEPWEIHLGPSDPLGYGSGVFELDEDLRPIRWLIRPTVGGEHPEQVRVMFIHSTLKTIGLVVASSKGAVLQVYTRQGVLLNEASLGRFVSGWATDAQLLSMGNGYLFSDRQLVWVSTDKDDRVWRFGPPLARTSTDRWGDCWRYFGDPLLIDGCLYVTGLDGHLYIFDSGTVTRALKTIND